MAENKDEKRTFNFRYIDNPDKTLQKWDKLNESFKEFGKIDFFFGFLCPICIAEIDIEERVRGEYSTIEKLILKLYYNGLTEAEVLSEVTGLNIEMVKNILSVLENGYGHIKDGVLTEDGLNSLETDINIQRYETTRQIQIEALTGCVLVPELSQTISGENPYYDSGMPYNIKKYPPTESVIVNLKRDFADILNEYQEYESGIFDRNIEMINSIEIEGSISVECFMVKYSFLPHPFILLPSQAARFVKWVPVAISQSNKEEMDKLGIKFDREVVVCSDEKIEKIVEIYNKMFEEDEKKITRFENPNPNQFTKRNPETKNFDTYRIKEDYKNATPIVRDWCFGKVEYCEKI